MAALTEAQITRQIRDTLKACGIFHYKHWQGAMSYPPGISDIIGCYKGRFFCIEVKRPGLKPTENQMKFIRNVREAGGIALVATKPEDVIEALKLEAKLWPLMNHD